MGSKLNVQVEYTSLEKNDIRLKFIFIDINHKKVVDKFNYDLINPENFLGFKENFNQFIESHNYNIVKEADLIITSNDVFNTTLIMPKTSKSNISKFVENDLIDKFGIDYKQNYRIKSLYFKYKNAGVVVNSTLISNTLINQIKEILSNINLKIKSVTTQNLLVNEKAHVSNESKVVMYLYDDCCVINTYITGALVETNVNKYGKTYLYQKNIVLRRKAMEDLMLIVISMVGKYDTNDAFIDLKAMDIYCNDDAIYHVLSYVNPLKLEYNRIDKEKFNFDLFKSIGVSAKSGLLKKGFSLVEVIVAVAIFSICSVGLISSMVVLSRNNIRSVEISKVQNQIENIATVYQHDYMDETYLGTYYKLNDNGILKFDADFNLINEDDTTTSVVLSYTFKEEISTTTTTSNLVRNLTLSNVKMDIYNSVLYENIVISTLINTQVN